MLQTFDQESGSCWDWEQRVSQRPAIHPSLLSFASLFLFSQSLQATWRAGLGPLELLSLLLPVQTNLESLGSNPKLLKEYESSGLDPFQQRGSGKGVECVYTAPESIWLEKTLKRDYVAYTDIPQSVHFSTQDSLWSGSCRPFSHHLLTPFFLPLLCLLLLAPFSFLLRKPVKCSH